MIRPTAFITLILFFSTCIFAQPCIEWNVNYGESFGASANAVQLTSDGGYITVGDVSTNGSRDFLIIKVDKDGNLLWEKTFGGSGIEQAAEVIQTIDSGFIVVGYTNSMDGDVTTAFGNADGWIIKLSNNGDLEWEKSLGKSFNDRFNSIKHTDDGNLLVCGETRSELDPALQSDFWIIKITNSGDILWEKTYGGSSFDFAISMAQTDDGGYFIIGYTASSDGDVSSSFGNGDGWLIKLDENGELQWDKTFGSSTYNGFFGQITEAPDGNFIITGNTENADTDVWILKINPSGDILWEVFADDALLDEIGHSANTNDGGFIVAAYSLNIGSQEDYWIIKYDENGNEEWDINIGGSDLDTPTGIQESLDGGYIISGGAYSVDGDFASNTSVTGGAWLTKLNFSKETLIEETVCEDYELVVNGTLYNNANPSGIETIPTGVSCDSIITIDLTFDASLESTINYIGCQGNGYQVELNGNVYNEQNPIGTEILSTADGCDSIVTINLSFNDSFQSSLNYVACIGTGYELELNGNIYNEQNPTGTELLYSVDGCDSIIMVNLTFNDSYQSSIEYTGCEGNGYNIELNGNIYNEQNPIGTELYSSQEGCDSIVSINLTFIESIESMVEYAGCQGDGYEIALNGNIYNEQNPSGSEVLSTIDGCDSIVTVDFYFEELGESTIDYQGCYDDEYSIIINGQTYNEVNPVGSEIIQNTNGCDSLVNINLQFYSCESCETIVPAAQMQVNKDKKGNYSISYGNKVLYNNLTNSTEVLEAIAKELQSSNSKRHASMKLSTETILKDMEDLLDKMENNSIIKVN